MSSSRHGSELISHLVVRAAVLDEILALRHRELRPGLALEEAVFDGDTESTTRHFAAFLGADAVGCATLMRRPWRGVPAWQLRGMATRADLARRGIGTVLLRFVERAAGEAACMWCNARLGAVRFYEKLGWSVASERFEIAGVGPHHVMVRRFATCTEAMKP